MSDPTPTGIEIYRDGELIETRNTARVPTMMESPVVAALREELATVKTTIEDQVSARIAALEGRTSGLDLGKLNEKLARIEERINRAGQQAQAINPAAVEDPGARKEGEKVKQALTPTDETEG